MNDGNDMRVGSLCEAVRHAGFLSRYPVARYCCARDPRHSAVAANWRPAGDGELHRCFTWIDDLSLASLLENASRRSAPQLFRTRTGLYYFAVSLPNERGSRTCLACGGMRDAQLDLSGVERLASALGLDPISLLKELESLPAVTFGDVAETAARTQALVTLLSGNDSGSESPSSGTELLRLVNEISIELDRAESEEGAVSLLAETLGVLFDLAAVGIARPCAGREGWSTDSAWGMKFRPVEIPDIFSQRETGRTTGIALPPSELAGFIPDAAGSFGTVIPLAASGECFCAALLIGDRPGSDTLLLMELLAGRAALRIAALRKESAESHRLARAERLLAIFDKMAAIDDLSELCTCLLDSACELVAATTGSIMLYDKDTDMLTISSVKGMNSVLAQKLTVRMGSGIAGTVASTRRPLLVNDILNDGRFPVGRRPRFRTGSFVSLPLLGNGDLLGVLNLADREDRLPFSDADLRLLERVVGHSSAIMRRLRMQEGVRHLELLSVTDPLTELYNRRFLERRMEEELARSIRYGLRMSVMLLDLDSFKHYNDICGHQAGDQALRQVARILKRSVREIDTVTRYGGEEFCILLPETPNADARCVAERIRHGIENELFAGEENLPLGGLTTSIGISTYPDNGSSAMELVAAADVALYRAKADGRNRIADSTELPVNGAFKLLTKPPTVQTH